MNLRKGDYKSTTILTTLSTTIFFIFILYTIHQIKKSSNYILSSMKNGS